MSKKHPDSAFEFLAPASISQGADKKQRQLSGIAYSGGMVTDHGYWDRLVIDLNSLSVQTPIPLLDGHNHNKPVGVINSLSVSDNLTINADLFADIDEHASAIANKADKGFPWQLSVGIWPENIEEIPAGKSVQLNGQQFIGPLTIFKGGRIREVSVVAIGADHNTSATVLNAQHHEESPVKIEELQQKIAALEAENKQLKDKAEELSAKVKAPDPEKYAPVEALTAMQQELAELKAREQDRIVHDLIEPALLDGRLLPAQEEWAKELGKTNLDALKKFIESAQPLAALTGQQTRGKNRDDNRSTELTADKLAALAAKYQAEQAAAGIHVDDIAAIEHVTNNGGKS